MRLSDAILYQVQFPSNADRRTVEVGLGLFARDVGYNLDLLKPDEMAEFRTELKECIDATPRMRPTARAFLMAILEMVRAYEQAATQTAQEGALFDIVWQAPWRSEFMEFAKQTTNHHYQGSPELLDEWARLGLAERIGKHHLITAMGAEVAKIAADLLKYC